MSARLWCLLARFLGSRQKLVDLLIDLAQYNPYSHLFHRDGRPYMGRWWLMPCWLCRVDETGHRYPFAWLPLIARIHHIRTPDDDRDLHDHPADYRSIILRGWYVEEDIFGKRHLRQQGDTVAARAQNFHTIVEVSDGGVWTLFMMGKKINRWGFLVDGHKIHWRKYCDCNGRAKHSDWQPLSTAPRDGTKVRLLIWHHNYHYASPDKKSEWERVVVAQWINFNGGGWTWSGMAGTPQAWRAMPTVEAIDDEIAV